ncbi:MAG: endonuclease/exonuclease/phosphatase family protein [Planctomycetes bacterium]|nr:endonuclease/exonuclease/phosphatase family protein [Planctomycetota bacterium]
MPVSGIIRRARRAWPLGCAVGLSLLWGLGQIERDRNWWTGMCFYIPSAVLAVVWLVLAAVSVRSRAWRRVTWSLLFALPPLVMVVAVENRLFSRPPVVAAGESVRLVHWNIAGRLRPTTTAALLKQHADLYVLSEVGDRDEVAMFSKACGPDYSSVTALNLAVVARGKVTMSRWLARQPKVLATLVTCTLPQRTVRVLVVDLPSWIQIPRDPLLAEICELIATHQPDLVVGDFNAPRRSRRLAQLPAGYQHAYETVGSGWGCTWPVPVPVYALDHCLHSAEIQPRHYELQATWSSDHRFQVFDFQ